MNLLSLAFGIAALVLLVVGVVALVHTSWLTGGILLIASVACAYFAQGGSVRL